MIHALDPVFIAEKIAFTPIHETVNVYDVVKSTYTGTDGIGGLESRGKYRLGLPKSCTDRAVLDGIFDIKIDKCR